MAFSLLYAVLSSDWWLVILWALLCDAFVGTMPVYLPLGLVISLIIYKVKHPWIKFALITILLWIFSTMPMLPSGWGLLLTVLIFGVFSVYGQKIKN